MSETNAKRANDGVLLIGGLFLATAVLMFAGPNLPSMKGDWVTLPLIGLPIIGSALLMAFASVVPPWRKETIASGVRYASLGISLIVLLITSLFMFDILAEVKWSDISFNQYVYEARYDWMTTIGVEWHVGIDGLSMPMVWLTAFLIPVTIITTWNEKKPWYYHPLLVMMGGSLIGVFVALDLFMFYIFWELSLIPMFFLILSWGGEDRRYAAQKFFIYTFAASVLMLLGIILLYLLQTPDPASSSLTGRTFDMKEMISTAQKQVLLGNVWFGVGVQKFLFVLLMIGFLVKLPAVPFHTWLPDAHVEAPTGGSMLLAGVMLKMGAYGMFRLPLSMFPTAVVEFQYVLMLIGMVSLVYGAWACLGQTNLKRMVAYSSVSHMGIIMLGIASLQPLGFAGALFMMFAWMASLGLPLLAGFVAEIAVLIAFWHEFGWLVLLPALTLVITATYYIWSMQRTIFEGGEEGEMPESLGDGNPPDVGRMENAGLMMLAVLIAVFGILPFFFWDMMSNYSSELIEKMLASEITGRWS